MCNYYFSRNMGNLAEEVMFLPKIVYFGRNKTISAETRKFWPNIRFWPKFSFCEWPISVFGVSAKNLFWSNTTQKADIVGEDEWGLTEQGYFSHQSLD